MGKFREFQEGVVKRYVFRVIDIHWSATARGTLGETPIVINSIRKTNREYSLELASAGWSSTGFISISVVGCSMIQLGLFMA